MDVEEVQESIVAFMENILGLEFEMTVDDRGRVEYFSFLGELPEVLQQNPRDTLLIGRILGKEELERFLKDTLFFSVPAKPVKKGSSGRMQKTLGLNAMLLKGEAAYKMEDVSSRGSEPLVRISENGEYDLDTTAFSKTLQKSMEKIMEGNVTVTCEEPIKLSTAVEFNPSRGRADSVSIKMKKVAVAVDISMAMGPNVKSREMELEQDATIKVEFSEPRGDAEEETTLAVEEDSEEEKKAKGAKNNPLLPPPVAIPLRPLPVNPKDAPQPKEEKDE
jgi:hypothetical protein